MKTRTLGRTGLKVSEVSLGIEYLIGGNSMNTTVHCDDDRVWLEGVNGWFIGDRESSVHAAQAAAMSAVGEDISYEYLVGVSGLAFRMQVSKDGLCPSSPHSFCGYPCHRRSSQALPWKQPCRSNTRPLARSKTRWQRS